MTGDYQPCDYCGKESMTNIRLDREVLTRATDTVYPSIPRKIVCEDCSERISSYLEKKEKNFKSKDSSPFTEEDIDELIDKIEQENRDDLTLEVPNYGYGYRYFNQEWLIAHMPLPPVGNRYLVEEHDSSEVKEKLLSSHEITLKQTDEEAWDEYLACRYDNEELLEELSRIDQEVDGTPTEEDIQQKSKYRLGIYRNSFGYLSTALEEAGVRIETVSSGKIYEEIKRMTEELGRPPSAEEVKNNMDNVYDVKALVPRRGDWEDTLEKAGVITSSNNKSNEGSGQD
jgi:hypothetical protein